MNADMEGSTGQRGEEATFGDSADALKRLNAAHETIAAVRSPPHPCTYALTLVIRA
jgi:hypothetical protein